MPRSCPTFIVNEYPNAKEVLQKIVTGSRAWQDIIPAKEHDRFVEAVKQSVQIYLNLTSPKDLRDELKAFEKATPIAFSANHSISFRSES